MRACVCACVPACVRACVVCVRACSPTRQCRDESVEGGGVKVQRSSVAGPDLFLNVVPEEQEEEEEVVHRIIVS